MLEAVDLRASYGGADVLHEVCVQVSPGEVSALVGANGSGKSTLANVIAGSMSARAGHLVVNGARAPRGWTTTAAVRAGIVLVPENRHIFGDLSVRDNLLLGAWSKRRHRAQREESLEQALSLFPLLGKRLGDYAGLLSGGQQQMLAIGRGLMARPRYLILDEPSLGLAPTIVEEIFAAIKELSRSEVGILLAEQNGRAALELADTGFVVERGRVTLAGSGPELLARPDIADRFLGGHTGSAVSDSGLFDRIADALDV